MNIEDTAWALFDAHRAGTAPLTHRAGGFVGQIAVAPANPLTDRQRAWLLKLTDRAGLPSAEGNDA